MALRVATVCVSPLLESHISGWGASKTVTARTMVDRLQAALTGLLDVQALGAELETQFGQLLALRAASAVLTTNSCEKPSSCAVIRRSTPGSTDGHVATAPSSTGVGSAAGQVRLAARPARSIRTNGCVSPPPENASFTAVAAGSTVPSSRRASVVSMCFQLLPDRVHTGRRYSRASRFPSGVAKTSRDSPRCETTSTGSPDFFARRIASLSETA